MSALPLAIMIAVFVNVSLARAQQCGEPPSNMDQVIKGELEGKAKFLTGFIGDAGLKGQIEAARTDVLHKYPNADRVRTDAWLLYMLCMNVLSDPRSTPQEKFKFIVDFRQGAYGTPK